MRTWPCRIYADIWLSGFAGLGFVSLLQWSQSKDRTQLFTGLLFLLLGFFIKREGSLWLMTGLLFALIQGLPLKLLAALILAMILAVFSGFSLVDLPSLGRLGYFDGAFTFPVSAPYGCSHRMPPWPSSTICSPTVAGTSCFIT